MDDVLKNKARSDCNEWSVSIGRDQNGTYYVSSAEENETTIGTIPSVPYGDFVAYGHSHGCQGDGVPSIGDLYSFLEMLGNNPALQSMYVYGAGWDNASETYAINVYDRQAVIDFLNAYPKNTYWDSFTHAFMTGSTLSNDYNNAIYRYNHNRDIHGVTYNYIEGAVALSYIMSKYNMGVTLTRRVNNDSFNIINAKDKSSPNGTIDITTCN